ncbi:MAG: hypothetical protein UR34_C0011G0012 [candidate division WS6 bacterium GW2011_GWC1_33_20]|uniref:Uncharacterized protein n=1 Tax=candidate division WS6 bacterium GW2011_GWC1_33_20 TaxID=1619089 RepID=A0A0F9ZHX0_9BACT|nr:MAG: hypothetical protein UR34_C0011G0012 [candidate division WS6 bacterium GW2011_GWC1_33_20]
MKIYFDVSDPPYVPGQKFSNDPKEILNKAESCYLDIPEIVRKYHPEMIGNYDEDTVKYAKLLESDPVFEERIKELRKEFMIPEEGFPLDDNSEYNLRVVKALSSIKAQKVLAKMQYRKMQNLCLNKFRDYKMPQSFKKALPRIVLGNTIDIPSSYRFKFEKVEDIRNPSVRITIDIYSPLQSYNSIVSLLDKYWLEIIKLLSSQSDSFVSLPPIENIEIWNLRNTQGLRYKEIASIINKKYNLDLDQSTTIKRYQEVKKKFKEISPEISQKSLGF